MRQYRLSATAALLTCAILVGVLGFARISVNAQALATPQTMETPMPVNVITNNPNGPNWLQAFDRPARPHAMHDRTMNHTMMLNHCRMMSRGSMMNHRMTMQQCMMMMQHRMMMRHRMMMQHPRPMPTTSP